LVITSARATAGAVAAGSSVGAGPVVLAVCKIPKVLAAGAAGDSPSPRLWQPDRVRAMASESVRGRKACIRAGLHPAVSASPETVHPPVVPGPGGPRADNCALPAPGEPAPPSPAPTTLGELPAGPDPARRAAPSGPAGCHVPGPPARRSRRPNPSPAPARWFAAGKHPWPGLGHAV